MQLLKILIILLLIFLPVGEILRFDLGNNIYLKPLDMVSVVLLVAVTILYSKHKLFRQSLKWYYFAFPIIGLVSLGFNSYWLKPQELFTSFLYLLRWLSYISIFFAVIQLDQTFKKKIVTFLLADGLVVLLIGYVQIFLYPSLRNLYYLGWDEHLYRMFSSFFDPNFVGAFFVLYLVFTSGLLFNKIKNVQRKILIFYGGIIVITLLAIFLTYSRSALLMLIASGITFFLLLQKKKFIIYLLSAIVIFVILVSPFFYIENLDLFRTASSIARLDTTNHALAIIQNNPFIGVGFDSYHYAQIKYHLIKPITQFQSHSAAGEDTSLLFVFATTGIIGLISYCYLWFRLLKEAKNNYKHNIFSIIFIASTVGLFINSLFNNSLFYPEIMFWMWIIVGLNTPIES